VKLFNVENTSVELDAKTFDKRITASYTNVYTNKVTCVDSQAVKACRLFLVLVFEKKEIHLYEIRNEKLEIIGVVLCNRFIILVNLEVNHKVVIR
jgi:hypothetical protein